MQKAMPSRRRRTAVFACLALTVGLIAGCSFSSSKSGGALPDGKTLVQQSASTTKNLKSVHLVLTVNGTVPGLSLKALTGDLTTTPNVAAKGNAHITSPADLSADFVVYGGDLYTNALSPGSPTMMDLGPASKIYDPSLILDPNNGVANLLANFTNAKAEGRDQISGQSTVRVTGNVSADAVNKIAPPFKATAPVPATVWIVDSGDHQLAQASLTYSQGNTVQMTLSNWNQPVQVDKPTAS